MLAAALQYVDVPGYSALLLRRTFPQLTQPGMLIPLADEWLSSTDAHRREGGREWVFPSGAILRFGHVQDDQAIYDYQGGAYDFIGFDELTQFTERMYEYIGFSRGRRTKTAEARGIPTRLRATANPGGIGHAWVKARMVSEETRRKDIPFIPAKVHDNPGLDTDTYAESLSYLPDVLVQQLLEGDWGAFEGAAYHKFSKDIHVIDAMPGAHLFTERLESMDYGINHPTAWHLILVDFDGNMIFADEYYEPALPSESAPAILARRASGWGRKNICYGDPNSLAVRTGTLRKWGEPATIQTEFADLGINITPGKDNPRAGYTRLRELIEPDDNRRFPVWHPRAGEQGAPRLFVVGKNCPELVDQFAAAPLQPIEKRFAGEMVDPAWEGAYGHALASARYGAMSRPDASPTPPPPPPPARTLLNRTLQQKLRSKRGLDRDRYYTGG